MKNPHRAGKRILVIEDNRDLAHLLELHLRDLGFEVALAFDGERGLEHVEGDRFDLVVLDLMLPGLDGMEVCRRIRGHADYTPILMLTSKSSELDRVLGLEVGADDYVTKPFSIMELMARVKAIFRRVENLRPDRGGETPAPVRRGDLVIHPDKRRVEQRGRPLELTAKEFDLLLHFARSPGRVYTRAELLDAVWGYGHEGYEHTVNSHMNRLRAKIEDDPSRPRYILTVWGVGYKFNEDP